MAAAPSRFCWHDLMTTDVPRATAFYTALFGWTTSTFAMGAYGTYTMLINAAMDIGGILPVVRPLGARSLWLSYVNVANVDGSCARAVSMGAALVLPSSEIPNVGRYAIIRDNHGATIALFARAGGDNPEPEDAPPLGSFAWDELFTTEPSDAAVFYERLLRWKSAGESGTDPHRVLLTRAGARLSGGVVGLHAGLATPTWMPHVAVEDVDASVARAVRLGAKLLAAAADEPSLGRVAVVEDTVGAVVALLQRRD